MDEFIKELRQLCDWPVEEWTPESSERERALLVALAAANGVRYEPASTYWMRIPSDVAADSSRPGRQTNDAAYWRWHTLMERPEFEELGATFCHRRLSVHLAARGVPEPEHSALLPGVTGIDLWRNFVLDGNGQSRMGAFHQWYDPRQAALEIREMVQLLHRRLEEPCTRIHAGQVLGNYKFTLLFQRRDPGRHVFPMLDDYCRRRATRAAEEAQVVRAAPPPREDEADASEPRDTRPYDPLEQPLPLPDGLALHEYYTEFMQRLNAFDPVLATCLRGLTPHRRVIFFAKVDLGMTHGEVAAWLGPNENAVRQAYHNARLALQACLRAQAHPRAN